MDQLVTPDNLSRELLAEVFEAAYLDVSYDSDGDLVVRDGFRIFVLPAKHKRWIKLWALFRSKEGAGHLAKLQFANRVNDELVIVRAAVNGSGGFSFEHYIHVDGGISRKNIVMATKMFMSCVSSVGEKDDADVIA